MQINVTVETDSAYNGPKKCGQVDMQIETDRFGSPFFKVAGINGMERFAILITQDGDEAVKRFWKIKKELLKAQLEEARRRQAEDDFQEKGSARRRSSRH